VLERRRTAPWATQAGGQRGKKCQDIQRRRSTPGEREEEHSREQHETDRGTGNFNLIPPVEHQEQQLEDYTHDPDVDAGLFRSQQQITEDSKNRRHDQDRERRR
jgi:hypothetical protein